MSSSVQAFDSEHPLQTDRNRLDRITDLMDAKIRKVLRWPSGGLTKEAGHLGRTSPRERALPGTGTSVGDILSEALIALLSFPPAKLQGSWEGLAVQIAHNKTADALRRAGRGLRGTDHRHELRVISGDAPRRAPGGELEPSILEVVPDERYDPEAEATEILSALDLRNLAREVLSDRDAHIFFECHFVGRTRRNVGEELNLTGQRIGQIYDSAMRRLEIDPRYPYAT